MSARTYRRLMVRPPKRLFHLVFESHSGRALVPSPKRSASPRAPSTLQWRIGLKALDPEQPIREADMEVTTKGSTIFKIAAGRIYLENLFAHTSALPSIPEFSQPAGMHRDAAEHDRHRAAQY